MLPIQPDAKSCRYALSPVVPSTETQRGRRETEREERDRERQREERPPRGRGWRGIMSDAVHMLVNVLFFDAISLMLLPFV